MPDARIIEVDENKIDCPRCGESLLDDDGAIQPYCEHVRFIFVNDDGFSYIDDDLEQELESAREAAEQKNVRFDTWAFLKEKTGESGVILERIDGGMACGPISFVVWVGIGKRGAEDL